MDERVTIVIPAERWLAFISRPSPPMDWQRAVDAQVPDGSLIRWTAHHDPEHYYTHFTVSFINEDAAIQFKLRHL